MSSFSPQEEEDDNKVSLPKIAFFGVIAFLYWYWMVLGSWAASNGLPGVPDFLPLQPGWPPSDQDLVPVLEDSQHWFYLSDLLSAGSVTAPPPYVQPVRLALFNIPEAWIFAFLPILWNDPKRINKYALLGLWAVLGINLTNAFLAPYLLVTELRAKGSPTSSEMKANTPNRIFSTAFGVIATAVIVFALEQVITTATAQDWTEMWNLIQTDRTYLAFLVDMILFSIFQPLLLSRVKNPSIEPSSSTMDYIPVIGLLAWLFQGEPKSKTSR